MGNKKLTFYIIYLFFIILIFESFSWGIIYFINKHPIIIKSKNFHKSKKLINEFNEYLDLIPYVDDALEFRKFIDIETSKNLFFDLTEPLTKIMMKIFYYKEILRGCCK